MTSVMTIVEFAHASPGYHELVRLRDLHLRQPIGLRLNAEDLIGEEGQRHFALVESGEILGGLVAAAEALGSAKLRQMWIHPDLRGQGHGRDLLAEVESRLASQGVTHFVLHSRENASGFYEKNGYRITSGIFTEVGRPHLRMEKQIAGWPVVGRSR